MRGSPAVGYLATRSGVSETHRHEVQMVVGGTEERLGQVVTEREAGVVGGVDRRQRARCA